MNVLIAPDKFKGSLSAAAAAGAIGAGLRKRYPEAVVRCHPLADGGDGTLDILQDHLPLRRIPLATRDPLGGALSGHYLLGEDVAFVEVATASGLVLLSPGDRNPLRTSTYGTGLLLAAALERGVDRIYLLLGGSTTHDVGTGIAAGLGFTFRDAAGNVLPTNGGALAAIATVEPPALRPWERQEVILLCDVDSPLTGPQGAARVYAAQKGATPDTIEQLEAGTLRYGRLLERTRNLPLLNLPGGGAAGGIAAGLHALLGARIEGGFAAISALTDLPEAVAWADHVITGEGQVDDQSLRGKVVDGVLDLCREQRKPCTLIVGRNALPDALPLPPPVTEVHEIMTVARDTSDAMGGAAAYLEALGERVGLV